MHSLLRKQLSKATDANGAIDLDRLTGLVGAAYDDADRDRRRTDRSITLMIDELAQLNEQLEGKVISRTAELEAAQKILSAALENVDQGIVMIGPDDRVLVCNRRAIELLDLPPDIAQRRMHTSEVLAEQIAAQEFVDVDPQVLDLWRRTPMTKMPGVYERRRPNGKILEVRTATIPGGGCVRTFTDITERREREQQIARADAEYRSLFENAVIGIYRTTLEGRVLRANPALARMNGYDSEADLIVAINDVGAEWYVDSHRRAEFRATIDREGRVDDFVSEVYRHKTRERIWVSESAWLVRSATGEPLCYEGTIVDSTERVLAEARIVYMARHDALTELATRGAFLDSLRLALRQERSARTIAVHCIDLDRFKDVNDTLGHPAGDQLLRVAAKRLRGSLREGCAIARLGGDEFAVIQRDVAEPTEAEAMAARLVRILSEPYRLDGADVHIGASVGVILATEGEVEAEELMKNVDIALYRAKAEGRSTYRLFNPSMGEAAQRRRALEIDLRAAVANKELVVYLQPIVEIADGTVIGFEALLRWRHPQRGMLSPGEFISIAEEAGLIGAIGEWVLHEACAKAAAAAGAFTISVNLSPAQFRTRRVARAVRSALAASGLAASRLVLEITESVLLMDDDQTKAALSELRSLGVRFALDDFGTGHSSLSYLQKFRFDTIKIDRSFVAATGADQVNATLVRAVISLGRELGISVVAEGIETEEQREKLASQGCRFAQGYLFGKPRPAHEWLDQLGPAGGRRLLRRTG